MTGVPARTQLDAIKRGDLIAHRYGRSWNRVTGANFVLWRESTRVTPDKSLEHRADEGLRDENRIYARPSRTGSSERTSGETD